MKIEQIALLPVLATSLLSCASTSDSSSRGGFDQDNRKRKPPTVEEVFKEMDVNKDGFLSKAEVKGHLERNFEAIDANKDGLISKEELKNAPRPERPPGDRPPR